MAILDWITIKGFKSIKNVECLKLDPINVLIGPNGSGKSSFIEVFSFLRAIRMGRLQHYVGTAGGADRILHFGTRAATEALKIFVSFDDGVNQYEVRLVPTDTDDDSLSPEMETVYFWDKVNYSEPYGENLTGSDGEAGLAAPSNRTGIAKHIRGYLDTWRLYHFHDTSSVSPMKSTCDVNDDRFLQQDGSNLAAFLYFRYHRHRTSYDLIRRTIQLTAPFFDDFALAPLSLNEDKIRLQWRHRDSDADFDAAALSDGTLRFIALTTLLQQPRETRPSVILLDEPELGLHPYAITMLASLVKKASLETQVVMATQSPFLLDHFEPEDVIVADRVNGEVTFTRLDSESLEAWLEDYSLGQLWEKNEIGGRPA